MRGRPAVTIDPKTVYWARHHGNTWDQVAQACGISRSTAIKLYPTGYALVKEEDKKRAAKPKGKR